MRKATFSVQKANANSMAHNSRLNPPKYLIGLESDTKNYYELIQKDVDFILEAQQIYKEKIKQTMQKKQVENLIQETVLTLQPNQNENDIKNLFQKLNKKYGGHELLEVSIHRDEGHFLKNDIAYYPTKNILRKDDGWYICSDVNIEKPKKNDFDKKVDINKFEKVYNYHAHAKFSMFDKSLGKSARMQKKDMSSRIKFVAEVLGLDYAPDKATSRIKKSVNLIKDEHLATNTAKRKIVAEAVTHIKKVKTQNKSLQEQNDTLAIKVHDLEKKSVSRPNMSDYEQIKNENIKLKKSVKLKRKNEDILKDKLELPQDTKQSGLFEHILKKLEELNTKIKNLMLENSVLKQRNKALELANSEVQTKIAEEVINKELDRLTITDAERAELIKDGEDFKKANKKNELKS